MTNLCVGGATTEDLVRDQLERGVEMNRDVVTVGIGTNDIRTRCDDRSVRTELRGDSHHAPAKTKAQIVLTNIPDISSAPHIPGPMRREYQQEIVRFNERLEEIAKRHGVTIFDIHKITTDELPSHPEYFSSDRFRLSDEGYEL